MKKLLVVNIFCSIVFFITAGINAAEKYAPAGNTVKHEKEELHLDIKKNRVLFLKYKGIPIIGSIFNFTVYEGNKTYSNSCDSSITDKTSDGKRIIDISNSKPSDIFRYNLQVIHYLAENRIKFRFEYTLTGKDSRISCTLANLAANPFMGCKYRYNNGKEGIIPFEYNFSENIYHLDELLNYDTAPKINESNRHFFKDCKNTENNIAGDGIEINSPIGTLVMQIQNSSAKHPVCQFLSKRNSGWVPNSSDLINWSFKSGPGEKQYIEGEFFLKEPEIKPAAQSAEINPEAPEKENNICHADEEIMIVPEPQQMKKGARCDEFKIDNNTIIAVDDKCSEAALNSAEMLAEELENFHHMKIPVTRLSSLPADEKNLIIITDNPDSELLKKSNTMKNISKGNLKEEGYFLASNKDRIIIIGADSHGGLYGVQTLLQMLTQTSDRQTVVPAVEILDWPDIRMRGLWLYSAGTDPEWIKHFIKRVVVGCKMNTLCVGVDQEMFFESHPEIIPTRALSKEQWKDVLDFARKYSVEIIPILTTFSGAQSPVLAPENKDRHLELAENPNDPKTLCLSNPDSYKIVYDLLDDVIKLFKPRHIFTFYADELRQIGICPRCKGTEKYILYANGINNINKHLAAQNVKTIMIGNDLLNPKEPELLGVHECNGGMYNGVDKRTYLAVDMVPKDTVVCSWHYPMPSKYGSFKYFAKKGFPVWAMPWYNIKNIYAAAQAAKDAGSLGLIAFNSNIVKETILGREVSFLPGMILTGEYAWSADKPFLGKIPDTYPTRFHADPYLERKRVSKMMNRLTELPCPASSGGFLVDLSGYCNIGTGSNETNPDNSDWFGYGPAYDLSKLPAGKNYLGGTLFKILAPNENNGKSAIALNGIFTKNMNFPERVNGIKIGKKAISLTFLHTTGWGNNLYWAGDAPLYKVPKIGEYIIRYTDGTENKVTLTEKLNIEQWYAQEWYDLVDLMLTPPYAKIAWEGKSRSGSHATVYSFEWINPFPEKTIKEIDFVSANTIASPVLLAITGKSAE